jgi:hypothetical protein
MRQEQLLEIPLVVVWLALPGQQLQVEVVLAGMVETVLILPLAMAVMAVMAVCMEAVEAVEAIFKLMLAM